MWNNKLAMISVFVCLLFPVQAGCSVSEKYYTVHHHDKIVCPFGNGVDGHEVEYKIETFDHAVHAYATYGSHCDQDPDSSSFQVAHVLHSTDGYGGGSGSSTTAYYREYSDTSGGKDWCIVLNCDNPVYSCEIYFDSLTWTDLQSGPCVCKSEWKTSGSYAEDNPACGNTQYGCADPACDGDSPWCHIENLGCDEEVDGDGWAYCTPETARPTPRPTPRPTSSSPDTPTSEGGDSGESAGDADGSSYVVECDADCEETCYEVGGDEITEKERPVCSVNDAERSDTCVKCDSVAVQDKSSAKLFMLSASGMILLLYV
jgi:hypothetical protein